MTLGESFNLLDEPWIPVLWLNGTPDRVGIRHALTQAGTIRQIAASNPMDNVALLRLLLAVLQWCKPTSLADEERQRLESARGIPDDWLNGRLGTENQPSAAFDLLGDQAGFYQDHAAKGAMIAVTNLLHDLPSGSTIAHFRHTRDHREGMCLPCCALGLVRWPAVASAGLAGGGQSMTASINGNTPAYSTPIGADLLASLLLTWPSGQVVEGDAPVWEGASEQSPLGILKAMTWRSRRVLLAPPDERGKRDLSPGRCCQCGECTARLVRSVAFRPGWRRPFEGPYPEDPHLLQITRKTDRGASEEKIVPSWPRPTYPLEDHASVWRSVSEGLLQRSICTETGATEFHTTLLGSVQALYKHVAFHKAVLPALDPDIAQRLLDEMKWLRQVTWITTAARARQWREPPKGHRVVETLCPPGAKGHAVRSGLCALSPTAERDLEEGFGKLMRGLVAARETGGSVMAQVSADWRDEVRGILRRHVGRVVDATTSGSPLRRLEALRRTGKVVDEAVDKGAEGPPTSMAVPDPDADGGGKAEHEPD